MDKNNLTKKEVLTDRKPTFEIPQARSNKKKRIRRDVMGLKDYDTCGINPETNPCGDANEY